MNHDTLKARQRAERHDHPTDLALRVHRALSWLRRAEQEAGDPDARFIFLWIAFNAAYATGLAEIEDKREQAAFRRFLEKILALDPERQIDGLVWREYSGSIRLLLDNPYVFPKFWRFHNGEISGHAWKSAFDSARRAAHALLAKSDTVGVLAIVLSRLYTLRNQLVHGGATWNSSVNRPQVRDCMNLLGKLVPIIIEVLLDHPHADWGRVVYPVVNND